MIKNQKLFNYSKLVGFYSLGVFFNQSINLILIPIFWSVLTPEDFGIIAVSQMMTLFLAPIYLFGASETIQRFYYKWTEEQRPHYISWFFWFIFCFTLLLTLILDLTGSLFLKHLIISVPYDPYLRLTLWSTFLVNFINFPIAISRIQQETKTYNILLTGSSLTQVVITIYLVKILRLGALGYLEGAFIGNLIWFLPTLYLTFKQSILIPSRRYFFLPIAYCAPISFAGVIEGFTSTIDRFFLDKYVPLATIGFYNLARQFASLVNILNSVAKLVFIPYIYKINALKSNAAGVLGLAGVIYGVGMTVPLLLVCTIGREVVHILDPSGTYQQIVPYISYFACSFYFFSLAMVMGRGMDLTGQTKWTFMIPLVGAAGSLFSYYLFLPEWGVFGVLAGLVIGSFVRNLFNIVTAIYYFPRQLYLRKLCLAWVLTAAAYSLLVFIQVPNIWLSLLFKFFVVLVVFAIHIRLIIWKNIKQILSN